MIKSFKHKGLKVFWETGNAAKIQANHRKRLNLQLTALNSAIDITDMGLPGYNLHPLTGVADIWSITVNKNWRVIFRFVDGHAYVINYEDYH